MQPRDPASPPRGRLVLALGVFAAAIAGVVPLLAWWPHPTKEKVNQSESRKSGAEPADDAEPGFFYQTVGHAPEAAAPSPKPRGAGSANGPAASYTLEISVAQSREQAEKLIDELHDTGIDAYYTPLTRAGQVVYRVRRGLYPSQRDADRAAVALRQEHAVEAKVVKLQ